MTKTYTADQIARYFLAKTDASVGDLISNLKLQKLCYYAQGLTLATRGSPLYNEPLEAWMHGPVVPDLYRRYRDFGSQAIPPVEDLDLTQYAAADRKLLDDVFSYFGQYSAWRLREMTHEEAPWREHYGEGGGEVIPHDILERFFSDQVSDDYRRDYEQISRREAEGVAVQRQV